jgi:endo-1,4-beta-xylanase
VDVLPGSNVGANLDDGNQGGNDPYTDCLPQGIDDLMAARWGALFEVFVNHADTISSVTVWGLSDGQSWLNDFPVRDRTNYPLLFDRRLQPKSSYFSVIEQAE